MRNRYFDIILPLFFSTMENIRKIMNEPIFCQLFAYVVVVAIALLRFTESVLNDLTLDMLTTVNTLIAYFTFNFIFCYFAESVTSRSFEIAEIVYDVTWYEFSMDSRRLIKLWIQRAQKPFYFKGLGMVTCSMETFLAVIKF